MRAARPRTGRTGPGTSPLSRGLDRVCPPHMGAAFRWLLAASWTANLGDGLALSAGPLLVASQTRDATLIALALLLQRLPWLLFGLLGGVIADRVDRVRLTAWMELVRVLVLAVLVLSIASGWVSTVVILAVLFLLGTADVFSNTSANAILPSLVERDDLILANARLLTGMVTLQQLAGPAVGAVLFSLGRACPFASQALLVSRVPR